MFYFTLQNHDMIYKVSFYTKLCGEEHQYTTSPFLFLRKIKQKTQKNININYVPKKNEAINIHGF